MSLAVFVSSCSPSRPGSLLDQVGHEVRAGAPRRVVALAPDVTEIAYAIGADPLLVAVSTTSDFPAAARGLPRISADDLEAILGATPDLVLATTAGNDPRVVDRLRALHVEVCTFDVTSLSRLADAVRLAGTVTGRTDAADAVAANLSGRIAAAETRARLLPRRSAVYVVWWDPLIVAAPGTFHDDLLRSAGLDNTAPRVAGRYPRVDPELLLDPLLTLVVTPDEPDVRATFNAVRHRPVAARLRSGATRVVWLPGDAASRPGPRLVEALAHLVAARETSP